MTGFADALPPDAEVIARILAGDTDAFGILVRRHEAGLLRFATRMLGSADAAADAVAEGLIRAYRHLATLDDPARFRTWVYRIVANRCKSHLGRRSAQGVSLEEAAPVPDPHDGEASCGSPIADICPRKHHDADGANRDPTCIKVMRAMSR